MKALKPYRRILIIFLLFLFLQGLTFYLAFKFQTGEMNSEVAYSPIRFVSYFIFLFFAAPIALLTGQPEIQKYYINIPEIVQLIIWFTPTILYALIVQIGFNLIMLMKENNHILRHS